MFKRFAKSQPTATEPIKTVYYDVAMNRLDEQLRRGDSLDLKAGSIFSFASIILPIFGAAFSSGGQPEGWFAVPVALALIAYLFLALVIYRAYQIQKYDYRPNVSKLAEHNANYNENVLREWVADACAASIEHNEDILCVKAMTIALGVKLLTAETAILSITLMLRFLWR